MSVMRVAVVGAGKRVVQDVLPALAAHPDRFEVRHVLARTARELVAGEQTYAVTPLAELASLDVDLVYLGVGKPAIPAVLARLIELGATSATLLVETPVLVFKLLGHLPLFDAFERVAVAEDCTTLPWISLVHRATSLGAFGRPRLVLFDRSAWRYHGVAASKSLLGCPTIRSARCRGARVELTLGNGSRAVVLEPRDYATGAIEVHDAAGHRLTDGRPAADDAVPMTFDLAGGRAVGLRAGEVFEPLTDAESRLLGTVAPGDTLTSHTEDLKRVGLSRLLVALHEGRIVHGLLEGLDDMLVDDLVHRLGRWRATSLTSLKSPLGRRLLSGALRLVSRG